MALIHFEELDSVEGYLKCAIIRDYLKSDYMSIFKELIVLLENSDEEKYF
jgi:hypothetical protein